MARPILFLSDYGLDDEYVGVCHAVIARIAPDVRVVDLIHRIPPHDVYAGALALAAAVPYAPEDAVYLAVVDPGVGTERRAVAVKAGEALLVGPDNGLLGVAGMALGGFRRAVEIDSDRVAEWPVSPTFHGRDVFAPAAARLALGAQLEDVGSSIDPASVRGTSPGEPLIEGGRLAATVIGVDRFGNIRLDARPEHLDRAGMPGNLVLLTGEEPIPLRRVRRFADLSGDEYGLLVDSAGWLAIVRNQASAADGLGLGRGAPITLRPEADALG